MDIAEAKHELTQSKAAEDNHRTRLVRRGSGSSLRDDPDHGLRRGPIGGPTAPGRRTSQPLAEKKKRNKFMAPLHWVMVARLYLILVAFVASTPSLADEVRKPEPHVVTSPDKRIFLIVGPLGDHVAYRVAKDGSFAEIWRMPHDENELFLSDDGIHAASVNASVETNPTHRGHVAITFYENGKKTRSHLVEDLVKDKTSIRCTWSHFHWIAGGLNELGWERNRFLLTTTDAIDYTFSQAGEPLTPPRRKFTSDIERFRRSPSLVSYTDRGRCFGPSDWEGSPPMRTRAP